ncbi:MAG: AzlC family ABC transporter permease [Clostridia bacterium]|nr:AzlC family ABC transporter permease [Clostridia bacterium]
MDNKSCFMKGCRDGVPIALGYFAVSFSLGIAARSAGFTAFQALLMSFFNNASAGEFAAFTLIGAGASYLEVALMTLVTNARYLLMSCALSQKLSPSTPIRSRMLIGFDVTDEIFGVSIAYPGKLNPLYTYGVMLLALPGWAVGTYFGVLMGNILPLRLVSALSVALYGMFIAVFMPPARKEKVIGALVVISMFLSWVFATVDFFSFLSEGMRVIFLTVAISALAALLFPVKDEEVSA